MNKFELQYSTGSVELLYSLSTRIRQTRWRTLPSYSTDCSCEQAFTSTIARPRWSTVAHIYLSELYHNIIALYCDGIVIMR